MMLTIGKLAKAADISPDALRQVRFLQLATKIRAMQAMSAVLDRLTA